MSLKDDQTPHEHNSPDFFEKLIEDAASTDIRHAKDPIWQEMNICTTISTKKRKRTELGQLHLF